jgi:hypothetical protein
MFRRHSIRLMLLAILASCTGCGGGQEQLRNDLKQTGLAYHMHHDANERGPANWEELIATAEKSGINADGIRRVQAAGYKMTWDVVFRDVEAGLSHTVLGEPPAGDGPTLLMDTSVRR